MEGRAMTDAESLLEALGGRNGQSVPSLAPTRAFAWARVSTDTQAERGQSLCEQLREIRAYAEKHKIQIVAEFTEKATAFQKEAKRVEFHRMLALARIDRQASAILVHDLSRFSRSSERGRRLVRELREEGI